MKKGVVIFLKVLLGLLLLILVLLFTVPVIFKEKIRTKVEATINESVNAKVTFADYKLGFLRNFPNLSFSLEKMSVTGHGKFEGDTLAAFKSFDLVFNLMSLFSNSGYEIKSIMVDKAVVKGIVLKDGLANWDITKPSAPAHGKDSAAVSAPPVPTGPVSTSGGGMKILLRRVEIKNSFLSYSDASIPMKASLENLNFSLAGNLTFSGAGLKMTLSSDAVTVIMDSVKYLNRAKIDSKINMLADLDSMKFTLKDNYFSVNDLKMKLSGIISMPGSDIKTDLLFGTEQTSFKTLMSLIPAVYMSGYENLKTSGEFSMSGSVKGIYSDADSSLPDVRIKLSVSNGMISYPALPEKLTNINVNAEAFVDGKKLDNTTLNLDKFHFELAGNPFDMSFSLKTPMSDPDFAGTMNGKIDLASLSKAIPMDSIKLSGVIEMAVSMAGRMSMIEKEQYDKFTAKGKIGISNMIIAMHGYPRVDIKTADLIVTPSATQLQNGKMIVQGTSDFSLSGSFENYIPYLFSNKTVKGKIVLQSNTTDVTAIMNSMSDTAAVTAEDTVGLVIIAVPRKIDLDITAQIGKVLYDSITLEKVNGQVIMDDGILSLKKTSFNILGGTVLMNADYDTRDTLKPVMKADFNISNIAIKDAFTSFVMVKKLAPAAKGIDGKINAQINYKSLLGKDMMPVINTIDGSGKIQSDQVTLVESKTFDKIKGLLKLGDNYTNTFKNISISFRIKEGRVYVTPFDTKLGNIKMNIGGDQGLDQTLNYIVKTEIPRSDLGNSVNSLIDNLSSQAARFGIVYKPADVIKVNVKVGGTFSKPEVTPLLGSATTTDSGAKTDSKSEAVKQIVGNSAEAAKEKLRIEAADQGDKLIKDAEEKGQQIRDEAAKAAEKVKQEAAVQGQNLIKAAESKGILAKAAAQKSADILNREAAKKADQLKVEADDQAKKLVEDAKVKKDELIKKI